MCKKIDLNHKRGAGPPSAVGRAPDSKVRGPGFDTQSGHILSFLLRLIQEGQLSVTGESMCTKYWSTMSRSHFNIVNRIEFMYQYYDNDL